MIFCSRGETKLPIMSCRRLPVAFAREPQVSVRMDAGVTPSDEQASAIRRIVEWYRSGRQEFYLAGYAGAGLYDSVLLHPPREVTLDYTANPLVWDTDFREEFSSNIVRIGSTLEKALGAPQDIEGAFAKGRFHVVQARPQVGLHNEENRND